MGNPLTQTLSLRERDKTLSLSFPRKRESVFGHGPPCPYIHESFSRTRSGICENPRISRLSADLLRHRQLHQGHTMIFYPQITQILTD